MFATLEGTVDQVLERRREARRREVRAIGAEQARLAQRLTEIVREADDEGDWQAAGCSSSAQWLAQISSSDHRTAKRITHTSDALRELPALDHALSTGALNLDQVAAAAEFATPESDAELARVALGKAPSAIALAARTLAPPTLADDQALYERRALSMTWTHGRRELVLSGRLPLEQGAAFEQAIWNIAKPQRALDKQAGTHPGVAAVHRRRARHPRSTRRHRRRPQAQPHDPDRAPQRRPAAAARRRRADQPRDSPATRLRRTPPHHQTQRPRPRALTRRPLRLLRPATRALQTLTRPLPVPRLHRQARTRSPPPHPRPARRQDRTRQPHPALPPPPQTPPRPPHPHQRHQRPPRLHRPAGRAITTNQPHAPPL